MWPTGTEIPTTDNNSEAWAQQILDWAVSVVWRERDGLTALSEDLDQNFVRVTSLIFNLGRRGCGRVVVSGVGKSGLIGRKWVSTFCSTGTPALYLDPSDAVHGDLGALTSDDLLILLTNSGETAELFPVLRFAKMRGVAVVVVTGRKDSALGQGADCILSFQTGAEACSLGLAPTTSTTALAALGDALAVCQMKLRGFSRDDFAAHHPGGHLGRTLLLKVSDCMRKGADMPLVRGDTTMDQVIVIMTEKKQGAAVVTDENHGLVGIVTDGDLRRFLVKGGDIRCTRARDVMTSSPLAIGPERLAIEARTLMESKKITQLVVMEKGYSIPMGLIHIHDLTLARLTS